MRKIGVVFLLFSLITVVMIGCKEENRAPYFTRVSTNGTNGACGVLPFQVEFYAIASGGDALDNPTGANLYLDIDWNFGDDTTTSGSSIVYHTYNNPGTYDVVVTVKDKDGDTARDTVIVVVRSDTLSIWAESDPEDMATSADTIQFNVFAEACGFDPLTGDYGRFTYNWYMDDADNTVYKGRAPRHVYATDSTAVHEVIVTLEDVALDIVRKDTLYLDVTLLEEEPEEP
ncbi:MAG: PKD domain-containing protein [bacterium]